MNPTFEEFFQSYKDELTEALCATEMGVRVQHDPIVQAIISGVALFVMKRDGEIVNLLKSLAGGSGGNDTVERGVADLHDDRPATQ